MLKVENLSVNINNKKIIDNISFDLEENNMLVILGKNGSGKTTIVKSILNDIKYTGKIYLEEKEIKTLSIKEIAKKISVLMQNTDISNNLTVFDLISLGRYSHTNSMFCEINEKDKEIINEYIKKTNLDDLKNRNISNLSGGELQRVYLCLAFVQDPNLLILDEPINHLDINNQIILFDILDEWKTKEKKQVISIVHDIVIAAKYSDKVLLIREGKLVDFGNKKEILSRENVIKTYDFDIIDYFKNIDI